ncbi:hypothetical protein [Arenimonas metalli]|uniref:hypothetical protein n=1 Tax=Arenimonas metalli TaxID=948077 RepID=UPI0012EBE97D|nr:hypothetical protein [Arenimonas metalli]
MSIHIESITVIARVDALVNIPGALGAFEWELGNGTYATDGSLARGAFMNPSDVGAFVARMEEFGLVYELNGVAVDIAIVDQLDGLAIPAPWLGLSVAHLGPDQFVSCAMLINELVGPVVFPEGWVYEGSLYFGSRFIVVEDGRRTVQVGAVDGVDSFVDLETGQLIHRPSQAVTGESRDARPVLYLPLSISDLQQREQACIELVCRDAVSRKARLPELIATPRPWWRPWPSRRTRPYPAPTRKTVGALAEMYGQVYESDFVIRCIELLYGDQAGQHYDQLLRLMQQRQGNATRQSLEQDPYGPLPTRRPVAVDWLNLVDWHLPRYDVVVLAG